MTADWLYRTTTIDLMKSYAVFPRSSTESNYSPISTSDYGNGLIARGYLTLACDLCINADINLMIVTGRSR